MTLNTSPERVDRLIEQSSAIYDTIDPIFDGEPCYRRMLRQGINTTAMTLREGKGIEVAGAQLLQLPRTLHAQPGPLDALANAYSDVQRATLDRDNTPESDARHAIHLMQLAAPYAQEYYPSLNPNKIAVYALIHDIIEAYAGDVASLGMNAEQEAQKNLDEAQALVTLEKEYGTEWPQLIELIKAYEDLADAEAQFTKTFDKLDPSFTHLDNKGLALRTRFGFNAQEFTAAASQTANRMKPYSADYPKLVDDRAELIKRITRVAFKEAA